MLKKAKKLLKWVILTITITALLMIGLFLIFKKDIQQYGIKAINSQITVPFSVSDYEVTLWKTFPNLSFTVYDLKIEESTPVFKSHLLEANEVSLVFNIIKVIQGEFEIQKIKADEAMLRLSTGERENFNILNTKESQDSSAFNIEDLEINSINFQYRHNDEQLSIAGTDNQLQASILLGNDIQEYIVNLEGNLDYYAQQGDTLIHSKSTDIATNFSLDNQLEFKQIQAQIGSVSLEGNGKIKLDVEDPSLAFQIKSKNLDVADVLPWVSSEDFNVNEHLCAGEINASANISGTVDNPKGLVKFNLEQGSYSRQGIDAQLERINTQGTIEFGKNENLKIPSFNATLDDQEIALNLELKNFSNPWIKLNAKGKLNLSKVAQLANLKQEMSGVAALDLRYSGLLKSLQNTETAKDWDGEGSIELINASIKNAAQDDILQNVNGLLLVNSNTLEIERLSGNLASSPFSFTGRISPIASYLFTESDQLNIDGKLNSKFIDYDKLVYIMQDEGNEDTASSYHFPDNVKLNLSCQINAFKQGKFLGKNISGTAALTKNVLKLRGIQLDFEGGQLNGDLSVTQLSNGNFVPRGIFTCKNIPIQKLMYSFDNFSQSEITSEQLSGMLNAEIVIAGIWDEYLNCKFPSLFAQLKLNITNGRLQNYAPLTALSKFVHVKELMDIQFEPISETIEIKDNWMYLSPIELKNNALNLSILSAKHSLDNEMDYHFKLSVNQLLSKKYNLRKNRDLDQYTNTTDGGMNLFIHMFGKGDDLKFTYDRQNTLKTVKSGIKQEFKTTKNLIKEELGLKVADSLKQKPKHIDVEWDE